jgi:beta-phosphoglucomutase-like phosphatase (HAD superfamily)
MDWLSHLSKDFPVGIATSSSRGDIAPLLERWEIEKKTRTIRTVEDVIQPKPAPEVYLRVAQDLNVAPGDCLVFEDSVPGITAATRAGMRVVGVTTSHPVETMPPVWRTVADFEDHLTLKSMIQSLLP